VHKERQLALRESATNWRDGDYVFCTSHGTPFAAASLRTMFKALLQSEGLLDIRFHDRRQSIATHLLSIGTHPKEMQELLGHGQIDMTMDTYSHVMPTLQRDTMARLDDLLGNRVKNDESGSSGSIEG
jgi:site-specific recombinase XerD